MTDDPDYDSWQASVGPNETKYTELVANGSPSFQIENDGSTLTRSLLVRWEDLDDAKNAFLGYPSISGEGGSQPFISRNIPDFAAIFFTRKNHPYLYATKLSGNGYGMPLDTSDGIADEFTDFPIYRFAKIDVTYETLTYDILTDQQMIDKKYVDSNGNPDESTLARYVTFEVRPGVEYLTLPQGGFKFVGPTTFAGPVPFVGTTPAPVQGAPGKITPNYDLTLTWHLVPRKAVGSIALNPTLQRPVIDHCLGRVNKRSFPSQPTGAIQAAQYAEVDTEGTGYVPGDVLTVVGSETAWPATFRVAGVDAGKVLEVVPVRRGLYTTLPGNPVAVTGGSGTGAILAVTWGASAFPVGTLLLTAAEIKPIRATSGERLYDIIYRFKYLPQGNQSLYYQGNPAVNYTDSGYFEVTTTGASNFGPFNSPGDNGPANIYPWADMNTLFRVPS